MGAVIYKRYSMCCHGVAIDTAVVMALAEGVVIHHDSNLLASNGGHITIG